MKKLALSSEIYLIKASELKRLPRVAEINGNISGSLAATAAPQAFSAASAAPQAFSAASAAPQAFSAAPGASLSPAAKALPPSFPQQPLRRFPPAKLPSCLMPMPPRHQAIKKLFRPLTCCCRVLKPFLLPRTGIFCRYVLPIARIRRGRRFSSI